MSSVSISVKWYRIRQKITSTYAPMRSVLWLCYNSRVQTSAFLANVLLEVEDMAFLKGIFCNLAHCMILCSYPWTSFTHCCCSLWSFDLTCFSKMVPRWYRKLLTNDIVWTGISVHLHGCYSHGCSGLWFNNFFITFTDFEPTTFTSHWSLSVQHRNVLFLKHSFNNKILQVKSL